MNKLNLSICILTFRRENLLRELLVSIFNQFPVKFLGKCEIVVIDTSGEGTAREVISFMSKDFFDINYIPTQKRVGIPEGRNLAIENAIYESIFFVDDDQLLPPDILHISSERMLDVEEDVGAAKFGLDVIFEGKAENEWVKKLKTFNVSPPFLSREDIPGDCMSTDGVFLKKVAIPLGGFDLYWSSDGGEDNDFFVRMGREGWKFESWTDLKLTDRVSEERQTWRYCVRDALRKGICRAKLESRILKKHSNWILCIRYCSYLFLSTIGLFCIFPSGVIARKNRILFFIRQVGKIWGFWGGSLGMYQRSVKDQTAS